MIYIICTHTDIYTGQIQHKLSADSRVHPHNRSTGTAGRDDAQKIYAAALQIARCISSSDNYKLCCTGRYHPEYHRRI